jgi:hypothetical protein
MPQDDSKKDSRGSSPVSRGGAGAYIEGELGAFYLLAMLSGGEARGLPGSRVTRVRFQGVDQGFALDDLVIHGTDAVGEALLEIQSKRSITFASKDVPFEQVCRQIARVTAHADVAEERHRLAVATERTSHRISGPYQDVLEWTRVLDTAAEFFNRLDVKGVASAPMRQFVASFRANLIAAGIEDDDEVIWRLLRRFQILEFDFEASAPLARTYALEIARQVLASEDLGRAQGLWSALIEISLATAKAGGSLDLAALRAGLVLRGFRLAGDRDFSSPRAKLAEMADHALADIGTTVAGVQLPRLGVIAALDEARDGHRLVELRGGPGVGKSAVLKAAADRIRREARLIVLDPVGTPGGGWSTLALRLGVTRTLREFLMDLAASGGAVVFVDSLEMFTTPERRRTVNDVLREASAIDGFSVIVSARADFGQDGDNWLAEDAVARLGPAKSVAVGELDPDEVELLRERAPQLRALLSPHHPAAPIARNLYRLSRLLKIPDAAAIRTEAALAQRWWTSGDESPGADVRAAQRLFADLADAALDGQGVIEIHEDSAARTRLLRSLTLREPTRDRLAFYHDVLRDWAVGMRLNEVPERLADLDLTRPAPQTLARGVEFAARVLLERDTDDTRWLGLLSLLSPPGAHGSWRRQALLAITRSERAGELLSRNSKPLLAAGGALLTELCGAIVAVETLPTADLFGEALKANGVAVPEVSRTLRTAVSPGALWLLTLCVTHAAEIPLQALPAVIKLAEVQLLFSLRELAFAGPVAKMLYGWLIQLDCRPSDIAIPIAADAPDLERGVHRHMVEDLRNLCLLMAPQAPDEAKTYLRLIAQERDTHKANAIRSLSLTLATTAPEELAALVTSTLIEPEDPERRAVNERRRALSYADSDYMPASPAQPPFLDLLNASKAVGLGLVRELTAEAVKFFSGGRTTVDNGVTLSFDSGSRFFPWRDTYFWSRDQAQVESVSSALKALEAWGHARLDAREPIDDVIADVLGPDGSCAAYVLIALDLLISHWPASRQALAPFVSSPHVLAWDRTRYSLDQRGSLDLGFKAEPTGRVRLADLQAKPSRGALLEQLLPYYAEDDDISARVRQQLTAAVEEIGPYEEDDSFGDPAFMGARALNVVDPANWQPHEGGRLYHAPPKEAEHLARLDARNTEFLRATGTESKISMAIMDPARGSAEVAREAVEYTNGDLPDFMDTDHLKSRSTRLITTAMLVARDGDDALLDQHEAWIRNVIALALTEKTDRFSGSRERLQFNRQAQAACALIHLWRRRGQSADRDALIAIAVREDAPGHVAFAAARQEVLETDPRLLKAAARAAFATARWRRRYSDDDSEDVAAVDQEKAKLQQAAAAAEIAWLDGGPEPAWPAFPADELLLRRPMRIRLPGRLPQVGEGADDEDEDDQEGGETAPPPEIWHVDTQTVAAWLALLSGAKVAGIDWRLEIATAYLKWTAQANGLGQPAEVELDRAPTEWNEEFFTQTTMVMLEAPEAQFEQFLQTIEKLPDRSFADTAEIVLLAGDIWYFNDAERAPDRVVALRARLIARTRNQRRWDGDPRAGSLSIDHDTGSLVARLLMNTHNPFTTTSSYLVPAVFDRIDPHLPTLSILIAEGPVAFVALCLMNTLLVTPRERHAEFFVTSVEAWFVRLPTDRALWLELGIGRRVIEWLNGAAGDNPKLLAADHPLRAKIDTILGRLTALGVPEAHELEIRIERGGTDV